MVPLVLNEHVCSGTLTCGRVEQRLREFCSLGYLTATGSVPTVTLQFHSTQLESSHRMEITDGFLKNCTTPTAVGTKSNLVKYVCVLWGVG